MLQIGIGGCHLMRQGDAVIVNLMVNGQWIEIFRTNWNSNFSHVLEAPAIFEMVQEHLRRAG